MARLRMIPNRSHIPKGRGAGAVVLRDGGPGGASSYMDMDDYIHTTGRNPYLYKDKLITPSPVAHGAGIGSRISSGLKNLTSKLENLSVEPLRKKKNIVMSF